MNYDKYGKVGKEIDSCTFVGTDTVYIQFTNGKIEKVTLPVNENKPKLEMTRFLRSIYPELTDIEIMEKQGAEWHAYLKTDAEKEEIEKAYAEYLKEEKHTKAIRTGAATGVAAVALLAFLGLHGCGSEDTQTETQENTTVTEATTEVKYDEGFNLVDMTPEEVIALLQSGQMNQTQADFFLSAYNWINDNAQKEAWETATLTDEQVKEANELLTSMGYEPLEGNEVKFGFTIEEAMSLKIRFGNYTKEELMSILSGENVEVDKLMNDTSNSGIRNYILYLVYSDDLDMNIADLVNFNDNEMAIINEVHGLWKEYKALLKEGKEEEAKEKITEFKNRLIDLGHNADLEQNNAISFVLRAYLSAGNVMSNAYNYQEEASLHVRDTVTGNDTEIKVELDLFDELTMRTLSLGYEGFNQDDWKKENGIAAKYVLTGIDDVVRSYADMSCSSQEARLVEYNEFASELRSQDVTAETTWAAVNSVDISEGNVLKILDNAKTEYDTYTDNTANIYDLAFAIDAKLDKDGKNPINMNYYTTVMLRNYVHDINVKVNPYLAPDPNVVIGIPTNPVPTEVTPEQAVAQFGVDAVDRAEEAAAAAVGAYDANTPEEQALLATTIQTQTEYTLQQIYNSAFNYYSGENYFQGTIAYDASWINNLDPLVRQEVEWAMIDAQNYKNDKAQNGQTTGGETTYYENTTTTTTTTTVAPAGETPTTTTTVVTESNQSEIDNQMSQVNNGGTQTLTEVNEQIENFTPEEGISDDTYMSDNPEDLAALLK